MMTSNKSAKSAPPRNSSTSDPNNLRCAETDFVHLPRSGPGVGAASSVESSFWWVSWAQGSQPRRPKWNLPTDHQTQSLPHLDHLLRSSSTPAPARGTGQNHLHISGKRHLPKLTPYPGCKKCHTRNRRRWNSPSRHVVAPAAHVDLWAPGLPGLSSGPSSASSGAAAGRHCCRWRGWTRCCGESACCGAPLLPAERLHNPSWDITDLTAHGGQRFHYLGQS